MTASKVGLTLSNHSTNQSLCNSTTQSQETSKDSILAFSDYCWVDTAFGGAFNRNHVCKLTDIVVPDVADCFVGMFRYKEEFRKHVETTGSVAGAHQFFCYADYAWFDIDDIDLAKALQRAKTLIKLIEQKTGCSIRGKVCIFFSGAKGFHIGIPTALFGLTPSPDFPQQVKLLAMDLAGSCPIDKAIYEPNRLWREANTKTSKSGLYKIPLTYDELFELEIPAIQKLAESPRGEVQVGEVGGTDFGEMEAFSKLVRRADSPIAIIPFMELRNPKGWIAQCLRELEPGNRNISLTRLAGAYHRAGFCPDDICGMLSTDAEKCGFPQAELVRLVKGVCRRYPAEESVSVSTLYREEIETKSIFPPPLTTTEFLANANEKIEWLVDNLFPVEGLGVIAGLAGQGKSWLLHVLAISCANGQPWLDHFESKSTRVLYIDEESPRDLLANRLRRLTAGRPLLHEENLKLWNGVGVHFGNRELIDALEIHIQSFRPGLILCDSLIRMHDANENIASEMKVIWGEIRALSRKYGCFFLFADHEKKPGIFPSAREHLLRGSTDKMASIDVALSVYKRDETIEVAHTKARFNKKVADFRVAIVDDGPETVFVRYVGASAEIRTQRDLERGCDRVMDFLEDQDDFVFRQQIQAELRAADLTTKDIDGALKFLVDSKQVERVDDADGRRGRKKAKYRLNPADKSSSGAVEETIH